MKKTLWLIGTSFIMIILILDPKTAGNGAHEGISLCLYSVIPALFPLITVSTFLNSFIGSTKTKLLPYVSRLLGIPDNAIPPLIIGLLGGYPTGAQCASQLFLQGQFSANTAARLISLCNNCGPAFLFGIVASQFSDKHIPWEIWMILLTGNFICWYLYPIPRSPSLATSESKSLNCTQAIKLSTAIMASICGWIIIMRVIIEFLTRWFLWRIPQVLQVIICGLLELTNGTVRLTEINDISLRFIVCTFLLSFGGCCVTLQTYSVIHPQIERKYYFPGKLLCCLVCTLLAIIYQTGNKTIYVMSSIAFYILIASKRKNSSIFQVHRI